MTLFFSRNGKNTVFLVTHSISSKNAQKVNFAREKNTITLVYNIQKFGSNVLEPNTFFFKVFLDARKWAGSNVHKILKFLALDLFLRKFTGFSVNMVIWGKLISIF